MKKFAIYILTIISFSVSVSSFSLAMNSQISEKKIIETLDKIISKPNFELQSPESKLILLLESKDREEINFLMDSDILQNIHPWKRHLFFIKLFIHFVTKNTRNYNTEKILKRLNSYKTSTNILNKNTENSESLNSYKHLDEAINIRLKISNNFEFIAKKSFLKLGALIRMKIEKNILPIIPLNKLVNEEMINTYLMAEIINKIPKHIAPIIDEAIYNIMEKYFFISYKQYLENTRIKKNKIFKKCFKLARMTDEKHILNYKPIKPENEIENVFMKLINKLNVNNLKKLVFIIKKSYFYPQILNRLLLIKLLSVLYNSQETIIQEGKNSNDGIILKNILFQSFVNGKFDFDKLTEEQQVFLEEFIKSIKNGKPNSDKTSNHNFGKHFYKLPQIYKSDIIKYSKILQNNFQNNSSLNSQKPKEENKDKSISTSIEPKSIANSISSYLITLHPEIRNKVISILIEMDPFRTAIY